jgi:hypothetical protein
MFSTKKLAILIENAAVLCQKNHFNIGFQENCHFLVIKMVNIDDSATKVFKKQARGVAQGQRNRRKRTACRIPPFIGF